MIRFSLQFTFLIVLTSAAFGQEHQHGEDMTAGNASMNDHQMSHPRGPKDCSDMEVWDIDMGMCMPFPMEGMPMRHLMIHGNGFLAKQTAQGPRGRNAITSPNMFMIDIGTTVGDRHYLNLDFMGTLERWTFPEEGYPELLQIGEADAQDRPFLDAQHPHNSPVMGLTLSDTIKIGESKDHIKVFFAPRGQATDGPIAFMHRPTGMVNPDAPLGHHLAQDVGHITSTVLGTSLRLSRTTLQVSAFNGSEPEPTKTDIPMGPMNSVGARAIYDFSDSIQAMASWAYVKEPEHDDPTLDSVRRYSASVYNRHDLMDGCTFQNALIFGQISNYDHVPVLNSLTEEFLFEKQSSKIWGRVEFVQRTPSQLQIAGTSDPLDPRWVKAATLGYTHGISQQHGVEVSLGGSVTKTFIPDEFRSAYGGEPWASKIFLQIGGMGMWQL